MATAPKPEIPTIREVNVKAIADALAKIGERFRLIDAAILTFQSSASTEQMRATVQALQRQVGSLQTAVAALQASGGSGGAVPTDDRLLLLLGGDEPPPSDTGLRLLWPADAEPPHAINDASAILAARVFGA